MTRSLYGMTPGEVIATVNADPTTADSTHRDFGPISATVQIWNDDRTAQVTDLMSVNMSTLQPASAISVVTADSVLGRTPFFGADGYSGPYWAKDAAGSWWRMNPSDVGNRVTPAQLATYATDNDLTDLDLRKSDIGHVHDDRYYTQAQVDAKLNATAGGVAISGVLFSDQSPPAGTQAGAVFFVRSATTPTAPVSVTYVGGDHPVNSNSTTSISCTTPAGTQGGDQILVFWTTAVGASPTDPTGFSLLTTVNGPAGSLQTRIYTKTAAGTAGAASSDASQTVTAVIGSTATRQLISVDVYRHVVGVEAYAAVGTTSAGTAPFNTLTPTTTTVNAGTDRVGNVGERAASVTVNYTAPSGFTIRSGASTPNSLGTGGKAYIIADNLTPISSAGTAVAAKTFVSDSALTNEVAAILVLQAATS